MAPALARTILERIFLAGTLHVTQPYGTFPLTIFGLPCLVDGFHHSQLIADHLSVLYVPVLVAHRAPFPFVEDLYTASAVAFIRRNFEADVVGWKKDRHRDVLLDLEVCLF